MLVEPVFALFDRLPLGAAIAGQAEDAGNREARGAHQRVVLGDDQILEHGHAGEEADVLEGARHLGALRDAEIIHALEDEFLPSSWRIMIMPSVGL